MKRDVVMRSIFIIGAALAIGLSVTVGTVSSAKAQMYGPGYGMMYGPGPGMMYGPGYGPQQYGPQQYGPGVMGPGMMYGPGYGPGMMYGPGYGPNMMYGPGAYNNTQTNLNISANDAKTYFERWIATQGNPRLKVGNVKEQDADTIVVDIVTKDNSLVQRFLVNRHNGSYRPGEG